MNERIKKITQTVKEKWSGFSTPIKVMLLSIPVVIIAIIILLAILLNHKDTSVLYSNLTTEEAVEIGAAIEQMGIDSKDIQISGGTIKVPAEKQNELRMKLAVQGYPKNSTNYSIWNDGQNIWNTQGQLNEIARQQREANIAATVRQLDSVLYCTALLDLPDTKEYTINPTNKLPTCSLTLTLNNEEKLTNEEARAIYKLVSKAVEGLTYENIEILDTKGRSYDYISKEEEEAEGIDKSGVPVAVRRLDFQQSIQSSVYKSVDEMLKKMFGENGYSLGVDVKVNFDKKSGELTNYTPSPESNGGNSGVLSEVDIIDTRTDLENIGDLVGDGPNADLSPDYPTYIDDGDNEGYHYYKNLRRYKVSEYKEYFEKDGYSIDNVSLGVGINTDQMSETDQERLAAALADVAGTTVDKVHIFPTTFVIPPNQGNPGGQINFPTRPYDPYRNMLLMLVIALGIILVILLIVSLFISKSRKKKIRRRQELAFAAAQAAAENNVAFENEAPEEVDFNITSLTEEAGRESRETILKREIAEFARTSPDIVASIIRNMLRDE